MLKLRSPSLFALLAALAACSPTDPPVTTDAESSTGGAASTGATSDDSAETAAPTDTGAGTSTGETGATEAGDTGTTSDASSESGASTSSSETGSTDTGATDTGSSDTGPPACEATWAVLEAPPDALAAHDLAWVGCEYQACGEDSEPGALLCEEVDVAAASFEYLGLVHLNDTGAFTTDDVIAQDSFGWLDGPRHVYRYDEIFYIATEADDAADQLAVFYTIRALELLRTLHPGVYQTIVTETLELPAEAPLDGFGWKNRLRSVVISFDTSPFYIAAGLTVLDAMPTKNMMLDVFSNAAAISIDRETIRGESEMIGTKPIYMRPTADENFLRYMREGLVETLVHELLHTRVDRRNSVDEGMNLLWDLRVDQGACGQFALEEALVAAASLLHFRVAGGLSDAYLDYYDVVLEGNLDEIQQCNEFAAWEQMFAMPSGVDPRYDLRIVDLE